MQRLTVCIITVLALATSAPSMASADEAFSSDVHLGPVIGLGSTHMETPNDQPGSLTYLYGTSFSGLGLMVGVSSTFRVLPAFMVGVDLSYSRSAMDGFAEAGDTRIETEIRAHDLRLSVPALVNLEFGKVAIRFGVGPELAIGVGSAVSETWVNTAPPDTALESTTSVWLLLIAQAGLAIDLGSFEIDAHARFGWNPMYPDTTAERFEGFAGQERPGKFIVGSDWYVMVPVAIRFGL